VFIQICRPGFRATWWAVIAVAAIIAATPLGVMLLAWSDRADRAEAIHDVRVYNDAIQGYERDHIPRFTLEDQRFMRFATELARSTSPRERRQAYLRVIGQREVPSHAPNSVIEALNESRYTTERRVRILVQSYGNNKPYPVVSVFRSTPVEAATYAHLRNDHRARGYPTSALPIRRSRPFIEWEIFLAVLFIYGGMVWGYLTGGGIKREGAQSEGSWALPANPGGWLVMLLYAPSFILLWGGALIRSLFKSCIWNPGKHPVAWVRWFLTEADLRHLMVYVKAKRATRQRELQERARSARIGTDVVRREIELGHARTEAEALVDPETRAALLAKIARAEDLLMRVKEARLRDWEETAPLSKEPGRPAPSFDELFAAVDALAEAEEVAPKS
jgi:hypothetical protein